jgi:hypothetical protein
MAAGDIKKVYASSSTITVTNLHSLAASSTYVGGWESGAIDNTTNLYLDYKITAVLVTHASNRQAGELRMYLVPPVDDTTWPDVTDGTESTESFTDTEERDGVAVLAAAVTVDSTASATYTLNCPSANAVFGGNLPKKFVIFITGDAATSTNAQLAAAGSAVYVTGSYLNVAQS